MKAAKRVEDNKRVMEKGLARTRAGYLPKGVDKQVIEKAAKLKILLSMDKTIAPPPDPGMKISPLAPDGGVDVKFP